VYELLERIYERARVLLVEQLVKEAIIEYAARWHPDPLRDYLRRAK